MTTIAYIDGVMAADTLLSRGNDCVEGAIKIVHTDKYLIGISGGMANLMPLQALIKKHEGKVLCPSEFWTFWEDAPAYAGGFESMIVSKADGTIWNANEGPPVRLPRAYDAIGSGADYACGAMAVGASAPEAVEAAGMHDMNTGKFFRFVKLND
jgi:ATP-dependent protease HslVU (ClpYQ) peptidase subunit